MRGVILGNNAISAGASDGCMDFAGIKTSQTIDAITRRPLKWMGR
jgi:hypothetical protein